MLEDFQTWDLQVRDGFDRVYSLAIQHGYHVSSTCVIFGQRDSSPTLGPPGLDSAASSQGFLKSIQKAHVCITIIDRMYVPFVASAWLE